MTTDNQGRQIPTKIAHKARADTQDGNKMREMKLDTRGNKIEKSRRTVKKTQLNRALKMPSKQR